MCNALWGLSGRPFGHRPAGLAPGLLFPNLYSSTAKNPEQHPLRRLIQALTVILSGAYLAASIKSFRPK